MALGMAVGTRACPTCRAEVPNGSSRCPACGANLGMVVERSKPAAVPVGWGESPPVQRSYSTFHERPRRRGLVPLLAAAAVLLGAAIVFGLLRAPGIPTPVPVAAPPLATSMPASTQPAAAPAIAPTAAPTDTPAPAAAAPITVPTAQPTVAAPTATVPPPSPTSATAANPATTPAAPTPQATTAASPTAAAPTPLATAAARPTSPAPTAQPTTASPAKPAATDGADSIRFGPPIRLEPRDDTFGVLTTNTTAQPKRVAATMTLRRATGEIHTARGELASLLPGQTRLLPLRSTAGPLPSLYETINVRLDAAQDAAADPLATEILVGEPAARQIAGSYSAEVPVENKGQAARSFELHAVFARGGKPLGIAIWPVTNLAPGERRVVRPTTSAGPEQPDAIHAWVEAG